MLELLVELLELYCPLELLDVLELVEELVDELELELYCSELLEDVLELLELELYC